MVTSSTLEAVTVLDTVAVVIMVVVDGVTVITVFRGGVTKDVIVMVTVSMPIAYLSTQTTRCGSRLCQLHPLKS